MGTYYIIELHNISILACSIYSQSFVRETWLVGQTENMENGVGASALLTKW